MSVVYSDRINNITNLDSNSSVSREVVRTRLKEGMLDIPNDMATDKAGSIHRHSGTRERALRIESKIPESIETAIKGLRAVSDVEYGCIRESMDDLIMKSVNALNSQTKEAKEWKYITACGSHRHSDTFVVRLRQADISIVCRFEELIYNGMDSNTGFIGFGDILVRALYIMNDMTKAKVGINNRVYRLSDLLMGKVIEADSLNTTLVLCINEDGEFKLLACNSGKLKFIGAINHTLVGKAIMLGISDMVKAKLKQLEFNLKVKVVDIRKFITYDMAKRKLICNESGNKLAVELATLGITSILAGAHITGMDICEYYERKRYVEAVWVCN